MENNYNNTNDILYHFKKLLMEDNKLEFSKVDIYNYLTNYNVIEKDYKEINEDYLDFDNEKLNSIEHSNNNYHLFNNKSNNIKCNNPIKLYIPIKYTHIKESIDKILNFFNKKNIAFEMKVTDNICNNDITIRLSNIDDTNKFINFIKYNDYINEGLLTSNPFCYNEENISFTIDGNLSYLSIITDYLYNYLKEKKDNIEQINIDDFYNYIIDLYNDTFINYSKYTNLMIPNIDKPTEQDILTYKKITEYILKVSEKKFTKNEFIQHFNECNDSKNNYEERKTFLALNTLINFVSVEKQYKSDNEIIEILKKYLETNNLSYITNIGFFRTTMYLINFKSCIEKIMSDSKLSLDELIDNLNIKSYNKLDNEKIDELLNQSKKLYEKVLNDENIKLYLATNDYTLLSRKDNIRNNIVNSNFRNNILNILFSKNISFNEFIEQYISKITVDEKIESEVQEKDETENYDSNDNKIDTEDDVIEKSIDDTNNTISDNLEKNDVVIDENIIFETAIMDTYNKYQALFEEKKVECDGFTLLNYALTNAIKNNDFSSFTRDNNSRINLAKLGNKKILEIICNKLGSNSEISIDDKTEIKNLIVKYLNTILFNDEEKRKGL